MKRLRIMEAKEASTDDKMSKTSEKQWKPSDFGAKRTVTAQNSNFWIQKWNFKPPVALLTSNTTYVKRLQSMAAGEAEKQSETVFLAPKRPLQLKIQILLIKICIPSLFLHY